jgi:hypothetical protein
VFNDRRNIKKGKGSLRLKVKSWPVIYSTGGYHSAFQGKGMSFKEVREYAAGDDIRFIDWNVSARFGHPFSKIFEEERELTVMFARRHQRQFVVRNTYSTKKGYYY